MSIQEVWPIVAIGSTLIGAVLYIIRAEMKGDVTRLDGRINAHEDACGERQKKLDERHAEANRRLTSIDAKLDRLLEER